MRSFIEKFTLFMQGRYGMDALNRFLIGFAFFLWLVNIFVFNLIASLILSFVQLGIIALFIFRLLSRNIQGRMYENRKFEKLYNPVKNRVKFTWRRFKDRKDYRYLKCPVCKAQLRVRNQKGMHTVRCPRCKSEFSKKI